ncbi:riboflavin synthase subunit alpha [Candidatus Desantisbacteria bacterium CG1_02_38_46]|uniref:Riboflavin synthase n=3 Tax=unclassified Candidatus Desantisiibacteriota TaxID=3106372 RepID=A0A2H9P9L5_9BACT|nr:MAG: riboflavin synthase subunit alpha [Candidatus Desantisbacteria bacterium CG1_02_38_46]PIU51489.1 MAG: riboflavin synthase [Candidatus Desantisbacteria bacterium CG07_land_8_20_14_0_80_39_15]PIZ14957.1 MAG: riboflavin synthase [Candidatus Desantisbacteria bacterium CG_4_10_14_0_8_um_filter_39_17]
MFTGIIKELGVVKNIIHSGLTIEFTIQAKLARGLHAGDSISVNGVCLTVTDIAGDEFKVDAVAETLKKTTLGNLKIRDRVNLEPPLQVNQPLGGHIINGHIDGVGIIKNKIQKGDASTFEFSLPSEIRHISKYIVEKGPIAVDGISLTVVESKTSSFTVSIIPFTLENTILGFKRIGDKVNLEVDIIAKYVEKIGKA